MESAVESDAVAMSATTATATATAKTTAAAVVCRSKLKPRSLEPITCRPATNMLHCPPECSSEYTPQRRHTHSP